MELLAFVLGAPDPEMELVDKIIRTLHGPRKGYTDLSLVRVGYATCRGARVRAESAYSADGIEWHGQPLEEPLVVAVECAPPCEVHKVCDHHRPEDPGYGRQPADYLPASSIGQVLAVLAAERILDGYHAKKLGFTKIECDKKPDPKAGWYEGALAISGEWYEPSVDVRMTAAADHCLPHAYRGECPRVNPDDLMLWRAEQRAKFQGLPLGELLKRIEVARKALRAAPNLELSPGIVVKDMRGRHVHELPEAAAREGLCFVADGLRLPDGRTKIVCQSGDETEIGAFMKCWAPQRLTDIYGDPARGFAGGYVT